MSSPNTTEAGFFDRMITRVSLIGSGIDYDEAEKRWTSQNLELERSRQSLLNQGVITQTQSDRLQNLDTSPYSDIAGGNGAMFVKAAADANENNINFILGSIWRAFPWYIWTLLASIAIVYLIPAYIKFYRTIR